MESNQVRIEWSIPGTSKIPAGSETHGCGNPIPQELAKAYMEHFHPSRATLANSGLRFHDFNMSEIPVGMRHHYVPVSADEAAFTPLAASIPQTPTSSPAPTSCPMGISSQGLQEIMRVLGGRSALQGLSMGTVFQMYADTTKMEDPVTPLTKAVRSMLGIS